MALIGRKPATTPTPTPERPKARPAAAQESTSRVGKVQRQVRDIRSELAKVTWPTREETRNLTIVVIGITVVLGALLGSIDALLTALYSAVPR